MVTGLDEETIEAARDVNHHTTSIDAPLGTDDDSDNTIGDMLSSDDNAFKSDSSVDQESMRTFIEDLLKEVLNEREQHIVKNRLAWAASKKALKRLPTRWA